MTQPGDDASTTNTSQQEEAPSGGKSSFSVASSAQAPSAAPSVMRSQSRQPFFSDVPSPSQQSASVTNKSESPAGFFTSQPPAGQYASGAAKTTATAATSGDSTTPLHQSPGPFKMNLPSLKMADKARSNRASANTSSTASQPSTSQSSLDRITSVDAITFVNMLSPAPASPNSTSLSTRVLVIDIRPSTSFRVARVAGSINVCAPSTLLKRSGISVDRIEDEMLASDRDRSKFARWRTGCQEAASHDGSDPVSSIVVLDTDTSKISDAGKPAAGGGGPCLVGMLRKFEAAGFTGQLCWLVGGFKHVASNKEAGEKGIIQWGEEEEGDAGEGSHTGPSSSLHGRTHPPTKEGSAPQLQLSGVGQSSVGDVATVRGGSADSSRQFAPPRTDAAAALNALRSSTAYPSLSPKQSRVSSLAQPRGLPLEAFSLSSTTSARSDSSSQSKLHTGKRGLDEANAMSRSGSQASSENAAANPFFDNIRQNRELAHGITERIPLDLDPLTAEQMSVLPPFLRRLIRLPPQERTDRLAQSFYEVELKEQQRLMATMQQHAAESCVDPRTASGSQSSASPSSQLLSQQSTSDARPPTPHALSASAEAASLPNNDPASKRFPFGIAAGLERGESNRYNNIWPYDHSRVRLSRPQRLSDSGSDYLNASFVAPLLAHGCPRRYIATQAPLPSTFEAFWEGIWEQQVRTVVMLTREHEAGRLQSHDYWTPRQHGKHLRLELVETYELDDAGHLASKRDDSDKEKSAKPDDNPLFAPANGAADHQRSIIVRHLLLSHAGYPQQQPRTIAQIQYIGWPDYHVPDNPDALLNVAELASAMQQNPAARAGSQQRYKEQVTSDGPMLVHCSAGVGRTGTFVVIDAVLDVLRRQRAAKRGQSLGTWDNGSRALGRIAPIGTVPEPLDEDTVMADADSVHSPSEPTWTNITLAPRRSLKRRGISPSSSTEGGNSPGGLREQSSLSSASNAMSAGISTHSASSSGSSSVGQTPSLGSHRLRHVGSSHNHTHSPAAATASASASPSQASAPRSNTRVLASPPPLQRMRSRTLESEEAGGDGTSRWEEGHDITPPAPARTDADGTVPMQPPPPALAGKMGDLKLSSPSAAITTMAARSPAASFSSTGTGPGSLSSLGVQSSASVSSSVFSGADQTRDENMATQSPPPPPSSITTASDQDGSAHQRGADGKDAASGVPTRCTADDGEDEDDDDSATHDLIRECVDVAREQRMSSVQTARQFVCTYAAVIMGVLREVEREKVK